LPTGAAAEGHHLVVVGASAGGVEALQTLAGGLPADFPAAVVVVLHLPSPGASAMPDILSRAGALPASQPVDGERISGGRIYVAAPGSHLTVDGDRFRVETGPRVNGYRPAIDPLFETAAHAHGERVVGVVLSGMLHDGAVGLDAIKRHGGLTIVQDPEDALYRSMPDAALEQVDADFVLPATAIGAALAAAATLAPEDGEQS
jgi:two-component system, chemotaxis family, protein-glutamate methylesterase/glutaminase